MRRRPGGASLAATLLISALALTLAMTLAGVGVTHANLAVTEENRLRAAAAAEAVIAQAIERLLSHDGDWFLTAAQGKSVEVTLAGGATARLTFDPDQARVWEVPLSTHNLFQENPRNGASGRLVPGQSAHLVGQGTSNGVTRTFEVVLAMPIYKYALSSTGPLHGKGLTVASAARAEDVLPNVRAKLSELLPGHVASNFQSVTDDAVVLDGSVEPVVITGDAKAAGTVRSIGDVSVGATRQNSGNTETPELDIADFDPAKFGGTVGINPDLMGPGRDLALRGLVRYRGDVHVKSLQLPAAAEGAEGKGAVIWVDGDITIENGVTGVGAIFATGNVTVRGAGGPQVSADSSVAIAAGKDLTIEGNGQNASFFQGVLFSGGDAKLKNVSALGSVLVGGTRVNGANLGGADPVLEADRAAVVHSPENVRFEFDVPFGVGAGGLASVDKEKGPQFAPVGEIPRTEQVTTWKRPGFPLKHFYEESTDSFDRTKWKGDGFANGSTWGFKDIDSGQFITRQEYLRRLRLLETTGGILDRKSGVTYATWDGYLAANGYGSLDDLVDGVSDAVVETGREGLDTINQWYRDKKTQPNENGTFTLDPNEFVSWDARTRVVLWREWREPPRP